MNLAEITMIFLAILIIGSFLSYAYVGWRLIIPSRLRPTYKRLAWSILLLLPLLIPLYFLFLITRVEAPWVDLLAWVAYLTMGLMSILFALVLLRDAAWALRVTGRKIVAAVHRSVPSVPPAATVDDPGRRAFLIRSCNMGLLGASVLMTGYGIYEARRRPTVVNVLVPLRDLPREFEGFRITQISDIHVGPTIKRDYVQMVADQVSAIGSDLIALTGDLVDGPVASLEDDVAPLSEISAPFGRYFVTGNHEYYSGVEPWIEEIRRLGFDVLTNEHRVLRSGDSSVVLAGVPDHHAGRFIKSHTPRPDLALEGAPAGAPKILMTHQPRTIFAAASAGFDLQLSGHTHGGQYFYGNLLVALSQPYLRGLHRHGHTTIYVNSGTGYWGPPLRLGVPSEITVITLTQHNDHAIPA